MMPEGRSDLASTRYIDIAQYAVVVTTVGSGAWYLVAWARTVAGADMR